MDNPSLKNFDTSSLSPLAIEVAQQIKERLPSFDLKDDIRYPLRSESFEPLYEYLDGLLQNTDQESREIIFAALETAPTRRGQLHVLNAISSRSTGEMPPKRVAEWIKRNIVTPFRVTGGRKPASNDLTNPFTDPLGVWGTDLFAIAASRNQDSLRKKVMQRDRRRCVITGRIDPSAVDFDSSPPGRIECTIAAHILPFSLCDFGQNQNNWGNKQAQLNSYWTSIQSFSGVDMTSLIGTGINDVSNAITLSSTVHTYYDRLELALKPIFPESGKIDVGNYQCQVVAFTRTAVYLLEEHKFDPDNHSFISTGTIRFGYNPATPDLLPPNPYSLAMHWSACEIYARCAGRPTLEFILSSNDRLPDELEQANGGVQPNLIALPDAFDSLTKFVDKALVHSDAIQQPLDAISYDMTGQDLKPTKEFYWDIIRRTVDE